LKDIAKSLECNKVLTKLNLSKQVIRFIGSNELDNECAENLAKVLEVNQTLKILNLST